jgi:ankyrin repeat protein
MSLVSTFKDMVRGKRGTLRDAILGNDIEKVAKILAGNSDAPYWDMDDGKPADKPLHTVLRFSRTNMLPLMLQPGMPGVNDPGNCGHTPLMIAMQEGSVVAATILLKKGADMNAIDPSGHSAIYHACVAENDIVLDFMLARGADINGPAGSTPPLALASMFPEKELLLKKLLKLGADPNRQDRDGRTALDAALAMPNHAAIPILLRHGASVNNRNGKTGAILVWSAAGLKNKPLVEQLLAAGADPELAIDHDGRDVLAYLGDKADPEIRATISNHIAAKHRAINVAAIEKEMAAGSPATISVKPLKLKS